MSTGDAVNDAETCVASYHIVTLSTSYATDAVYDVVPDANAGLSAGLAVTLADDSELSDGSSSGAARVTVMV